MVEYLDGVQCGSTPRQCGSTHCRCRYQHHTFMCDKYRERQREREREREVHKDRDLDHTYRQETNNAVWASRKHGKSDGI